MKRPYYALLVSFMVVNKASAGLMEGDDPNIDTFIDTTTTLEWMDFGVNNVYTADFVITNLGSLYPSWRLPTFDQVIGLYVGNFEPVAENTQTFNFNYAGTTTGGLFSYYAVDNATSGGPFNPLFEVMGFDSLSGDGFTQQGVGYYFNDQGQIGNVSFGNRLAEQIQQNTGDELSAFVGLQPSVLTQNNSMNSLLLVRDAAVPIPATFLLLVFGIFVMGYWRRRMGTQTPLTSLVSEVVRIPRQMLIVVGVSCVVPQANAALLTFEEVGELSPAGVHYFEQIGDFSFKTIRCNCQNPSEIFGVGVRNYKDSSTAAADNLYNTPDNAVALSHDIDVRMTLRSGGTFDFIGAFLGNSHFQSPQLFVKGFLEDELRYDLTVGIPNTPVSDQVEGLLEYHEIGILNVDRVEWGTSRINVGAMSMDSISYRLLAVPLPSTVALIGLGFAGLAAIHRQKNQQTTA